MLISDLIIANLFLSHNGRKAEKAVATDSTLIQAIPEKAVAFLTWDVLLGRCGWPRWLPPNPFRFDIVVFQVVGCLVIPSRMRLSKALE